MVLVELSKQDLEDLTVVLVREYLKTTNSFDERTRLGGLHDRIQEIRKRLPQ